MPILELPETALYYEDQGTGEPLLLIPGFASGAWSWAWQADEMARKRRVVLFDPRGISHSKLNAGAAVTIKAIAEDAAALLDHLGISRANVLGISFGGFAAQEFALRFPGRVNKLILAATSFGGQSHVAPAAQVLEAFVPAEQKGDERAKMRQHLISAFLPDFVKQNGEAVERFCLLREINPVPEAVYMQQLKEAYAFDAEKRSPQIAAQTLVLTGDLDAVVPMQNSLNLAAVIPDSKLEIIEGGGHMAFVEQAAEFNRRVNDFLS